MQESRGPKVKNSLSISFPSFHQAQIRLSEPVEDGQKRGHVHADPEDPDPVSRHFTASHLSQTRHRQDLDRKAEGHRQEAPGHGGREALRSYPHRLPAAKLEECRWAVGERLLYIKCCVNVLLSIHLGYLPICYLYVFGGRCHSL